MPPIENVFQIDAPSIIQFEGLVVSTSMRQGFAQSYSWKARVVSICSVGVLSATYFYHQGKVPQALVSHRQQASFFTAVLCARRSFSLPMVVRGKWIDTHRSEGTPGCNSKCGHATFLTWYKLFRSLIVIVLSSEYMTTSPV